MICRRAGPLLAALLPPLAAQVAVSAAAAVEVLDGDGRIVAAAEVGEGTEWCLHWNHSVTGGKVADCFVTLGGRMVLSRSYLHDFAAGLGHIPGRGVQRAAPDGGYWIEAICEPVAGGALPLRVGGPGVDHRLRAPGIEIALSATLAGARVTLRPAAHPAGRAGHAGAEARGHPCEGAAG